MNFKRREYGWKPQVRIARMIDTRYPDYKLKPAEKTDVPVILEFIKELAACESLAHEVVATEAVLRKSLFGARKTAEVILGFYREEPVAFTLFFHNFSTFLGRPGLYLEDLYVKREMRGKGFGRLMMEYLAHLAVKRSCGRLEWWCLDRNEPALRFYRSIGAEAMQDWTVQRISGQAMRALADNFNES